MTSQKISDMPIGTPSSSLYLAGYDSSLPAGAQNVRVPSSGLATPTPIATTLTINGSVVGTLALSPAYFEILNGTLSLLSSGDTGGLTLGGTTITALDPTLFSQTNGTATLLSTNIGSLSAASSLTAAAQQLVLSNGTLTLATLAQLATEEEALTQPAVGISSIGSQVTNQPFTVTGSVVNRAAPPTLYFADDGGSFGALPAGATVTSSSFTFTHAGQATGTHTLAIRDQDNNQAVSNTFTTALAPATAASFGTVPSGGVAGSAISGATGTLTPSYATAYAALDTGGVDQGSRVAFTGSSIPSFTPSAAGTYQLAIYAAAAGGTALATSSNIVVSSTPATGATLSGTPATDTQGTGISGLTASLIPAGSTGYVVLFTNGADEGTRQAFAGSTVPTLTPQNTGTYTVKIYGAQTGGSALATSANITVSATATAATIAGAPASGTTGSAITGLTDTLTPSNATGYAVLSVNGADEGTRQAFTGTSVPSLTPQATGTYTVKIYAALTGGTALATSSNIAVTITATAATIAGAPSTGSKGSAITGLTDTLTPSGATGYAVLSVNGADEGTRQAFTGTAVPLLTPQATGTYTVKIYAALTGGTALATSGSITVSGAATPTIGSSVSPSLVLDASKASTVTSDSAYTTPQTTNGGTIQGWKDSTTNGNNFSSSSNAAVLAASSQNGLNGVDFTQALAGQVSGSSAFAAAVQSAVTTGNGATIAMVLKYSALPSDSNYANLFQASNPAEGQITVAFGYGVFVAAKFVSNTSGAIVAGNGYSAAPPAGTLIKLVATFNRTSGTAISVNAQSTVTASGALATDNTFNLVGVGNNNPHSDITIYECDFWPTTASGTGGATPTGDVATIMNYLTSKWGS